MIVNLQTFRLTHRLDIRSAHRPDCFDVSTSDEAAPIVMYKW